MTMPESKEPFSVLDTIGKRKKAFKTALPPVETEQSIALKAAFYTYITEFKGLNDTIRGRMQLAIKENLKMDPKLPHSCGCPPHGRKNCIDDLVCRNRGRGIACLQDGHKCTNNPWVEPNGFAVQKGLIYPLRFKDKGFGLFAREQIEKGTFLGEYMGELMKEEDIDYSDPFVLAYVMKIPNTGVAINPTKYGGTMHLINHACEPNANAEPYVHNGLYTVVFVASRKILIHEEIGINYGWEYKPNQERMICMCGIECTGFIGKFKDPFERLLLPEPFDNILHGSNIAFWTKKMADEEPLIFNPNKKEDHCFVAGQKVGCIDETQDGIGTYEGNVLACLRNKLNYTFYTIKRNGDNYPYRTLPMFFVFHTVEVAQLTLETLFTEDEKTNIAGYLCRRNSPKLINNYTKELLPNYVQLLVDDKIPRMVVKNRHTTGSAGIGQTQHVLEYEKIPSTVDVRKKRKIVKVTTKLVSNYVVAESYDMRVRRQMFREYLQKFKYPGLDPEQPLTDEPGWEPPPPQKDVKPPDSAFNFESEEADSSDEDLNLSREKFGLAINQDYIFDGTRDIVSTLNVLKNEVLFERFIYYSSESCAIHLLRRLPIGMRMKYEDAFNLVYDVLEALCCNPEVSKCVFLYYEHYCLFCELQQPSSLSKLTCPICDPPEVMTSRVLFNQHFHQHHAICARRFVCSQCHDQFTLPSEMIEHGKMCDLDQAIKVPANYIRFLLDTFADVTAMRLHTGQILHLIKPGYPTKIFKDNDKNTTGVNIPIDVTTGKPKFAIEGISAKPIKFTVQKTHTVAQNLEKTLKDPHPKNSIRKMGTLIGPLESSEDSDSDNEDSDSFAKKVQEAKSNNQVKANKKKCADAERAALKSTGNQGKATGPVKLCRVAITLSQNPSSQEIIELDLEEELPKLTPKMMSTIRKAKVNGSKEDMLAEIKLVREKMPIYRKDVQTLLPSVWLNDTIINTYLGLIGLRGQEQGFPSVYIFSTHFYLQLTKMGYTKTVQRWTKGDDIFGYNLVLVPIHLEDHWCLACIDNTNHTIKYYDSRNGTNNECLLNLFKYISNEMQYKKEMNLDKSAWKIGHMKGIPQQRNTKDCGLFVCKFADYLSRGAKFTFSQDDMPYYRDRMIYELIKAELIIDPRRHTGQQVEQEFKEMEKQEVEQEFKEMEKQEVEQVLDEQDQLDDQCDEVDHDVVDLEDEQDDEPEVVDLEQDQGDEQDEQEQPNDSTPLVTRGRKRQRN